MPTSTSKHYPKDNSSIDLHNGDAMTQLQFHDAYALMPPSYRAELIGGVVFEPSPLGLGHGTVDTNLACILGHYAGRTHGVTCALNATVIMSEEDELQPDVLIRIEPEFGGQTSNAKAKAINTFYVKGAPELVAEVAHSSYAIDLHLKKKRYLLAGVGEYVVVCLHPARVYWFDSKGNASKPDRKGIHKSKIFPGLWIDGKALLNLDYETAMETLQTGMQTDEYAKFVLLLAERKSIRY